MRWGYVGDGCWELQGSPIVLGCIYGPKSGPIYRISLEKVATMNHAPGSCIAERIFEINDLSCDENWAMMLVEAHVENLLRRELKNIVGGGSHNMWIDTPGLTPPKK
jgi:hypothetical protein